jgi:hypothetical protein
VGEEKEEANDGRGKERVSLKVRYFFFLEEERERRRDEMR